MPVSGTVTLDGKPLSGVMVSFIPTGSTRGTGAGGYTDKAGKYELTATHGGKGTPVGEYRVLAAKLVMPDGSDFPVGSNIPPIDSPAKQVFARQIQRLGSDGAKGHGSRRRQHDRLPAFVEELDLKRAKNNGAELTITTSYTTTTP